MGNCCMRGSSSMVWAGDDWGSMGRSGPGSDDDKESLLGGGGVSAGAELRIKISKKQLEELLKRADEAGGAWGRRGKKEGAAERLLERLIEKSVRVQVRRRAWRPKLQSIPEYFSLN